MSGKITNLSRARKQKARDTKRHAGDENAARFGRTGAQKSLETREAAKLAAHLDQHKSET